ncbi:MAG: hypothetical protein KAR19_18475 [Bacteroidales bacterium]|nr:hypothetical protein [Bacteroidales bacterium]
MKRSRLEYVIPNLLALVITIGLIRYIPVLSTKYLMKVVDSEIMNPDDYKYYYDLDGDGTSEIISIYLNSSDNFSHFCCQFKPSNHQSVQSSRTALDAWGGPGPA